MTRSLVFPKIEVRDLQGTDLILPRDFAGKWNLVIVAFRRGQQRLVDSWVPHLEAHALGDPEFRFYELPAFDGGMAAAIKNPVILQRTLTTYGDLGRVTQALSITSRSTISLFLVNRDGQVHWETEGGYRESAFTDLERVLATLS
jgi:hypothetical protein